MARKSGTQRRSDRNRRKLTSSKNKLQKITDRLEYLNLNRENLLSRNPRHSSRYRKEFKSLLDQKRALTSEILSKEALLINKQAKYQNLDVIEAEQDRLWGDYRDREIKSEKEASTRKERDSLTDQVTEAKEGIPREGKEEVIPPDGKDEGTSYESTLIDPGYNSESTKRNRPPKMNPIERENRKRFGDEKIDALKIRHADWKKARKAGTLDQWRKKYGVN